MARSRSKAKAEQKPVHECVAAEVAAAKLTIAKVAKLTGWTWLRTMRRLRGEVELSAEDMRLLSRVLEKPVATLYGEAA